VSAPEELRSWLRQRLASGAVALADQALVSATNCLTTVIAVRALGLAGFGHFALLWMCVLLVLALQQACISTPMLTIGPKQSGADSRAYYAGLLRLECAFLGCVALVAALAANPLARASGIELASGELAALLVCSVARCAQDFARQRGFAREERRRVLALDALGSGLQLAGLVGLCACGGLTPARTLFVLALSNAIAVVGWSLVERGAAGTPVPLAQLLRRHLGMSRWLVAQALLSWLTTNAFALAAGLVLGPVALGAIKAGQTVMGFLHVWLLTLENVAPVRAARLVARGAWAELRVFWRSVHLGGGLATLAVSGCVALLPGLLARAFYGSTSAEQELVIRAFALLYLFVFAGSVLALRLRTLEHTRPIFLAQALGAGLGTLAARPAVEAWGLNGALAGMIVQQALVCAVLLAACRRVESEREAQAALS
jgi:O-antigen/teichoic acid export membrane protein